VNINALRDSDNDPGFYAAVSSSAGAWPGAVLYQSRDGGASYQALATLRARATMGRTVSALGSYSGGNTVDELNTVTVYIVYGTLASVTYAGLLEGINAALIGDEIVSFRTATLNPDGSYTLAGLLRGRRGTEAAISGHVTGERFVLLSAAALVRIAQLTDDIGKARLYKAVTSGTAINSTEAQTFTNAGAALKPYAPAQLGGGRLADGALLLSWVRRGRISGEWRDSVDVPLSEAAEAYEVEIWAADFAALKRTISGLGSAGATYAAADQVTDFGSVQAAVCVRVYQISATVGRGYPASAVI
jgi:hypothetical protein